jgi:hypothetical protein
VRTAIIAGIVSMLVSAASASAAFVITSKNIKNGTIQLVDISPRAKAGLRGQRGPRGQAGLAGPTGPAGGFDPSKVSYRYELGITPPGGAVSASASCLPGEKVIGGGFDTLVDRTDMLVLESKPSGNSWTVRMVNEPPGAGWSFFAYAVCAAP